MVANSWCFLLCCFCAIFGFVLRKVIKKFVYFEKIIDIKMQTRVDKWLWAVRIFKTRSDAAEACRTGKITVNGTEAKPSKEIKEGDVLTVKKVPVMRFTYRVEGIIERRLPAKDVPTYCTDLTSPEEMAKLNPPKETIFVVRERGTGRPTKKERRDLDALWEQF
jgi:ribosome-associated heat shock protein Hsp15